MNGRRKNVFLTNCSPKSAILRYNNENREIKGDEIMAKTVLIVEDDRNIADLLRLYLEKEGYEVAIAFDGLKGVEKFREVQPSHAAGNGRMGRLPHDPQRIQNADHHAHRQK